MCFFCCHTLADYEQHVIRSHQHDPNFSVSCCMGSCEYTTKQWATFRVHMYRHKLREINNTNDPNDISALDKSDDEMLVRVEQCFSDTGYCTL